jgi:hypothetical protein
MARTAKKTRTTKPGQKARAPLPTERDLRTAGLECADLAAAGERLGIADLEELLGKKPRLAAAWERGQLLRRVRDVASTTVVVPERADRLLGLDKGTFERLYKADRIVRELWDRSRYEILVEIERALVVRVKEGDLRAVTAVEHLFGHRTEPAGSRCDWGRLTPTELETATGIKRAQWDRWTKENGCPRHADGTFALADVVDWLRRWERDKVTGAQMGVKQGGESALERLRRVQADELMGRLIDREMVGRLLKERAGRMVQILGEARAQEWAQAHEGKTAAQLRDLYLAAFRQVREIWGAWPAEVPVPEAAKELIEQGLKLLVEEGAKS